jgi:hypothetical protein
MPGQEIEQVNKEGNGSSEDAARLVLQQKMKEKDGNT